MPPDPDIPDATGMARRLVTGGGAQALDFGVRLAERFVMVPVFIAVWGAELYGDWLLVLAAASFAGSIDLGLGTYFTNRLTADWSTGARAEFARRLGAALGLSAILLGAGALLLALVVWQVPLGPALDIAVLDPRAIAFILSFLGLNFLLAMPIGLLVGLYRARGAFARGILWGTLRLAGQTVAVAAAVIAGAGPVGVALAYLVALLVLCAAMLADQIRCYPDLAYRPRLPQSSDLADAGRRAPYYWLAALGAQLSLQGLLLVVGVLAGPGAAVLFATSRTVSGVVRTTLETSGWTAGNEMSRQYAQDDPAAMARLFRFHGRMVGGLGGALAGLVAVIGAPFLDVWTLGQVVPDQTLLVVLLAAVMIGSLGQPAAKFLHYANHPRDLMVAVLIHGAGACAIAALLVPSLGVLGAALGLMLAEAAAIGLWLPLRVARRFGLGNIGALAMTAAYAGAGLGASYALARLAASIIGTDDLVQLIGVGSLWLLVIAPLGYLTLLRPARAL